MKETLEEAIERLFIHYPESSGYIKAALIGAKWQQERSYSEKEVLDMLTKLGWIVYQNYSGNTPMSEWMLSGFEQFKKK